eukprot:11174939-Ditylum_brightwellii.AAC.1
MEETHFLQKCIGTWHANPCPVDRPQQTIWHTNLHDLHIIGTIPIEDNEGKFATWFPQATENSKEWERHRKLLTSNLIGRKDLAKEQMGINNVVAELQI